VKGNSRVWQGSDKADEMAQWSMARAKGQPQAAAQSSSDTPGTPPDLATGSGEDTRLWSQDMLPAEGELPVYRPEQDPSSCRTWMRGPAAAGRG